MNVWGGLYRLLLLVGLGAGLIAGARGAARMLPPTAQIAFNGGAPQHLDLRLVDVGSLLTVRLAPNAALVAPLTWSPSGDTLAYVTALTGVRGSDHLRISHPGSPDQSLFPPLDEHGDLIHRPIWSPDGTRIAFTYAAIRPLEGTQIELIVVDLEGQVQRHFLRGAASSNHALHWLDAERLLYIYSRPSSANTIDLTTAEIRLSDLSEAAPAYWTLTANRSGSPLIAPDGHAFIIGAIPHDVMAFRLFYLSLNAQTSRPLLNQVDTTFADPAWSPDSTTIALALSQVAHQALGIVTTEGQNLDVPYVAAGARLGPPAWSTDGRQIAFTRALSGENHLCILTLPAALRCPLRVPVVGPVAWR